MRIKWTPCQKIYVIIRNTKIKNWMKEFKKSKKKIKNRTSTVRKQKGNKAQIKGRRQEQRTGAVAVWKSMNPFLFNFQHVFYLFWWRILPRSGGRRAWGGCSGLGRPLLLRQENKKFHYINKTRLTSRAIGGTIKDSPKLYRRRLQIHPLSVALFVRYLVYYIQLMLSP